MNQTSMSKNHKNVLCVILSEFGSIGGEVKNLINSTCYKFEILRLTPQNDIFRQANTAHTRGSRRPEKNIRNRFFFCAKFLIGFLSALLIQCSINKPTAPTWNVKLSVPLVNRYYDMATLIDKMDEPYLKLDTLGNPLFYFEEELDTIRLVDKLRCDSTSVNFKDTLGIMNLHPSESKQILVHITEFYNGPPGYVPPCSATIEEDLDTFSTFSQITVKEAFTTLMVSNHLGLNLDSVQIKIIDRSFSDTLQTVIFPGGIDDGDSNTQKVTFVNKTFSNRLGIQIKATIPGGEIQTLEDKYLFLDFTVDSLKVIQGRAKVPAFDLSKEETISLSTKSIIDSAQIKTGIIFLNLRNFTNLGADVEVHFPELMKDDHILSVVRHLPVSGHSEVNLVLDGYTFRPVVGNEVRVQTKVWSSGSEGSLIDFNSSDSVGVNGTLSETIFSQICGIIESTRVEIDQITRQLEIPPGFESAHLTNASLNLEIHNGVDLPANLSVVIQGEKGQNLSLQAEIEAGSPFGTAITSIFEDQLESLLSPVPQTLTVTGEIICGDGQTFGIVKEEDFLFGKIIVSSSWELILDSCQIQIDQDSDEVNDDVKELIQDQINSGKVMLKVESHLPLEAEAEIFFSQNQENLFSNPDLVIGPVNVPAGELNHNGSVKESSSSQIEINVSYQDIQVFKSVPFYMAGSIDFPGTNGGTIKATSADFIKISSYLELNVKNKKE